jgi:hypothetical protein
MKYTPRLNILYIYLIYLLGRNKLNILGQWGSYPQGQWGSYPQIDIIEEDDDGEEDNGCENDSEKLEDDD